MFILAIDDGAVADVDVVDALQSFDALGLDACLAVITYHIVDVDILELRCPLAVSISKYWDSAIIASLSVDIVALKGNGLARNVVHHDVADIEGFRSSASSQRTLESQTDISAAESVVSDYDSPDATGNLAAQHKATMGVVHGIVHDYHVFTSCNVASFGGLVAL